ncbi:MAG: ribosome-binding factor A [Rickettsiales bacterium]|jgi:ribosome-binding factor A|nr:ribosome-binding factor A [Rickettsiales bacterium]
MRANPRTGGNSADNFRLRRSSRLKDVLNEILSKSEFFLENRRIFVSALQVEMSRDLGSAKVFVDIFGLNRENQENLLKKLNGEFARQIRGIVAGKIRARLVPTILFCRSAGDGREKRVLELIEKHREEPGAQ